MLLVCQGNYEKIEQTELLKEEKVISGFPGGLNANIEHRYLVSSEAWPWLEDGHHFAVSPCLLCVQTSGISMYKNTLT